MSYIKYDRLLLTNLEKSLDKEMLRSNDNGAYSSTTIIDCNTRKYHGLLVVPVPQIDADNHVLLSSCDETVIQHGAEFNLGLHKYDSNFYVPRGHKYLREFEFDSIATSLYRIGGVILKKERIFVQNDNRVLICYTVLDAQSSIILRLKPFLAFRNVNALTYKNNVANTNVTEQENGVSLCLYTGYPNLVMQFNKQCKWVNNPDWYLGIEYAKEQERGYDYKEDLFVPGWFDVTLKKGEVLIFSAATEPMYPRMLKRVFDTEKASRSFRTSFLQSLKISANQFVIKRDGGQYIIAGYPWFKCRARDEFISLPGVTLYSDKEELFHSIMKKALVAVNEFISDKQNTTSLIEIDSPDALLWFIATIQKYALKCGIDKAVEKYSDVVFGILSFIRKHKHPNLFCHDQGLLYTNGRQVPVSWMNAVENGLPIVPRSGYLVEINALWYNALKFAAEMAMVSGAENQADLYNYQAEMTARSFNTTFWNGSYLYDFVDDEYSDKEVRPNMIFAVSLPYSPLDKKQQKTVVDIITRELLTPKGLRSLSPKSGMYRPEYIGGQLERDRNYHNGPVWPWINASFVEAYYKVYHNSGISFLRRLMAGVEQEMNTLTIGTLSELYDGNPPFRGHGAMSFAMSVAENLRAMALLSEYEQR